MAGRRALTGSKGRAIEKARQAGRGRAGACCARVSGSLFQTRGQLAPRWILSPRGYCVQARCPCLAVHACVLLRPPRVGGDVFANRATVSRTRPRRQTASTEHAPTNHGAPPPITPRLSLPTGPRLLCFSVNSRGTNTQFNHHLCPCGGSFPISIQAHALHADWPLQTWYATLPQLRPHLRPVFTARPPGRRLSNSILSAVVSSAYTLLLAPTLHCSLFSPAPVPSAAPITSTSHPHHPAFRRVMPTACAVTSVCPPPHHAR